MYDFRNEIVGLAERALQCFVRFRLHDMGIENSWTVGLKDFVETNYPAHKANYNKLYVFFQNHDEKDLVLEEQDITSLATLVDYYVAPKGIYDIAPDKNIKKLFTNRVAEIRELRNTFEHYTKDLTDSDASLLYYDQLFFTEGISSFAVLVMKYKGPSDEWKKIYHEAREIINRLHGERWLALDDKEKILKPDDDMSTILSLADQGNIDAQVKAGKAYFHGVRVQFDPEKAYMWFYKAAKKGNPEAEYYLGKCLSHAFGVPEDFDAANAWYEKSAEKGFAAAQYELGFRIIEKLNDKEAFSKLFTLLKRAADQDYPDAVWHLGVLYEGGYGVKKDRAFGKQLQEKAASLGYWPGSEELARAAEKKGDYATAIKWYELASTHGRDEDHVIKRLKRKMESASSQ